MRAAGVQVGADPLAYRMEYELVTGPRFITRRGPTEDFAEALDCDIAHCPVTNTMPVLRERLMEDREPEDFVMAWVSVPDLAVHRSEQRYEPVSRGPDKAVVRYVGRHRSFVGELQLDGHGLVVHYPQLADLVAG